jgi:hypothetical protein
MLSEQNRTEQNRTEQNRKAKGEGMWWQAGMAAATAQDIRLSMRIAG